MALYMAKEPEAKLVPTWWEKDDDEYPPEPLMPPAGEPVGEPLGPTTPPENIPGAGDPWGVDEQAPDGSPEFDESVRLVLETPEEVRGPCRNFTRIPVTMRIANFIEIPDEGWVEEPSTEGLDAFRGEVIRLVPVLRQEDIPTGVVLDENYPFGVTQDDGTVNVWIVPDNFDFRRQTYFNYTDWRIEENGKVIAIDIMGRSTNDVRVWVSMNAKNCPGCTITFYAYIPSRINNIYLQASSRTTIIQWGSPCP